MNSEYSTMMEKILGSIKPGEDGSIVINAVEWSPEVSEDENSYKEENPQLVFERFKEGNGHIKNMDLTESLLAVFKENFDFISKSVPVARFEDSFFIRDNQLTLAFLQLFKNVDIYDSEVEPSDFTDKEAHELMKTTSLYLDIFNKQRVQLGSIPRLLKYITDASLDNLLKEKPAKFEMRGYICRFTATGEMIKFKEVSNINWHLGTILHFTMSMVLKFFDNLNENQEAPFHYEVEKFKCTIKWGNWSEISWFTCEDMKVDYYQGPNKKRR